MEMSNVPKESASNNTLRSIAGIANQLEVHISDAMGVVRTAVEESSDEVMDTRMGALYLIWYRLEQIQKAHAQIVKLAPRLNHVEKSERRVS